MNVIAELMARAGVEQKEMAAEIGVSQPTISDWKRNKKDPKGENLQRVADYFGVTPQVIKGLDPIPGVPKDDERELLETSQALREDPDRAMLLQLAKHGSAKDVRAAAALIGALRATNPDFYDGDDPA